MNITEEKVKSAVEKIAADNWTEQTNFNDPDPSIITESPHAREPKEKIDGPDHYNGYQVIDAIWDAGYGEGFCLGNVVKYILRAEKKDNKVEDIKKAEWYFEYYVSHKND